MDDGDERRDVVAALPEGFTGLTVGPHDVLVLKSAHVGAEEARMLVQTMPEALQGRVIILGGEVDMEVGKGLLRESIEQKVRDVLAEWREQDAILGSVGSSPD